MPSFKYTAKDINGKKVSGTVNSTDENELYSLLKAKGLYLLDSEEVKKKRNTSRLGSKDVAYFCRQLGTLLNSGISLVRSLTIMVNQEDASANIKNIISDMLMSLKGGESLSYAMTEQGSAFPILLVNMVKAAEMNGTLDTTILRMADFYTKDMKLNNKVKGAMVYPMILLGLTAVVVVFICTFVMPQFSELFAGMETLPITTVILLGFSDFVVKRWYILIGGAIFIVVLANWLLDVPGIRLLWDKFKVKFPLTGNLLKTIYTARFARTLSSLYASGLPIISCIDVGKDTIGNTYVESQFDEVKKKLKSGEPFSVALKNVDGFVIKLISSIEVGEESGNLESMLVSTSDILDDEADQALTRLVSMLEPLMIIVIGIIVVFVVAGVIVPIYDSYGSIV